MCFQFFSRQQRISDCALLNKHHVCTWMHISVIFGLCAKSVRSLSQLGKRFGWAERDHGNRSG